MSPLEEQLIAVLLETPHETDCSVSAAVLDGFGFKGEELQAMWLNTRRAASQGKIWQHIDERWEYTMHPVIPEVEKARTRPQTAPGWRTQTKLERLTAPIEVKSVVPLLRFK